MIEKFDYSKQLDIGDQVAEKDWDSLKNHFVPIGTNKFVGKPKTSIIVGRKGSGKSALRVYFERTNQNKAVSIQPSSADLKDIFEHIVQHGKSAFAVEPLEVLWETTVLLNLARLGREEGSPISHSDIPPHLAQELNDKQRFGIGRTLTLITRHITSEQGKRALIRALREYIHQTCQTGKNFYVLIDSVDDILHNSFDTTKRNDLFATFLESLLNFTRNFSNPERNKIASNIHLQIFIPTDLYKWSVNRHDDHLRQYKHPIKWTFEQLSSFATSRLRDNLRHSSRTTASEGEVWKAFFPDNVEFTGYNASGERYSVPIPVDKALIRMTLMRPRDLLEVIRQIDHQTKSAGRSFPNADDVRIGLQGYSVELFRSVLNEYGTVYPELPAVLARFAYNAAILPRDLVTRLIGDAIGHDRARIKRAMQVLYESSILGAAANEREATEDPVFSYTFDEFESVQESMFFVVHRAFLHALRVDSLSPRPERG